MSMEVRPIRGANNANWPISHTNGGSAAITKLLDAPVVGQSHYITGYHMNGGGDADGFTFVRQRCVLLNAGNANINIADDAALDWDTKANDGNFTLNLWAKFPETMGTLLDMILRGNDAADGWAFQINASELVEFIWHDSVASESVTGVTAVNDGEWHMWTITVDRNSATGTKIYRDGILEASADATTPELAMDGGTTVVLKGKNATNIYIGQLAIYVDKALSLAEITELYNGPNGSIGSRGVGKALAGDEENLIVGLNMDGNASIQVDIASGLVIGENNLLSTEADGIPLESDIGASVGPIANGTVNTDGGYSPHNATFSHAIKVGNGRPLVIDETDGAFNLVLFGYTDSA